MTENNIELLDFEMIKSYHHDEWYTRRFERGCLQIEFTYLSENDTLDSIDLTIDEIVSKEVSLQDVKDLDRILNKRW